MALIHKLENEFGQTAAPACLRYIVAHEYGHQIQFLLEEERYAPYLEASGYAHFAHESPKFEIQADVLAGFYMGYQEKWVADNNSYHLNFYLGQNYSILNYNLESESNHIKALRAVQQLGHFAIDSIGHHGTPVSHYTAVKEGYEVGLSYRFYDAHSYRYPPKSGRAGARDILKEVWQWSLGVATRLYKEE